MTHKDEPKLLKNQKQDPIMDDDLFSDLMEARFAAENNKEDELEKARVWKSLSQKLKKPGKTKTWLPLAAAALLIFTLLPSVFLSPDTDNVIDDSISRIKGAPNSESFVFKAQIEVYKVLDDGKLSELKNEMSIGDTLVFKAKLKNSGNIALIQQRNSSLPMVRFISESLPSNTSSALKRENHTYGYAVEASDKLLRFCIIGDKEKLSLQEKIDGLSSTWSSLSADSCRNLVLGN